MKLAKVPKVGDILKFKSKYTFTEGANIPAQIASGTTTTITSWLQSYQEIGKGSLAEVVDRDFYPSNDELSDDMSFMLALAVLINGDIRIIRFNYLIHKDMVEILKPSKALKLLYNR